MTHLDIGKQGEQIAQDFLRSKGYSIITTNWHGQYGELDIVAQDGDWLAFVEVKTRQGRNSAQALQNITPQKQERFINCVHEYLAQSEKDDLPWRIDAIAVTIYKGKSSSVEHIQDAFDW